MAHLNANAREWKPSFGAPASSVAAATASTVAAAPSAAAPTSPQRNTNGSPTAATLNSNAKDASWRLGHAATAYRIKGTERTDPAVAQGEPECGPFRCWHALAPTAVGGAATTIWNRSAASQLFNAQFAPVKTVGDEQPCTSQGFSLVRRNLFGHPDNREYAAQLARSPGILLAYAEPPSPLDWTTLVDAMLLHRPPEFENQAASLVIEAIGYFTTRRCDYLFVVASGVGATPDASTMDINPPPPQVPCQSLAALATRLRRQLPRLQRVSTWQSLLPNVLTVVSLPRSAVVVIAETEKDSDASVDVADHAIKSVQVGRHLPTVTRVVRLPAFHSPTVATSATIATVVQQMHCAVPCPEGPHPSVTILLLRVPQALSSPADHPDLDARVTAHAASEYLRLVLQVLQQFVLMPGGAIDARPGAALNWHSSGITEQMCVVRLPPTQNSPTPQLMADLTHLLWPLPTSATPPTLLPRRSGLPSFFDPIASFEDLATVSVHLQSALAQRDAAEVVSRPRRLLRSNYIDTLAKAAHLERGCVAYRRPFGARVFVVAIPSRVTMPEGSVSMSWSLYIADAVGSVVASLPSACMTSMRPLPDGGVLVLEGHLCGSHLGADQWKIVISDIVQLEGEAPPPHFEDRVGLLTQLFEEDVKFCFRHPHGVALVRSCFVPATEAFETLCSANALMVDYAHCGLVVRPAADDGKGLAPWFWCPSQATVIWFRAGKATRTPSGDERVALRLAHAETKALVDYRCEYVDVPPVSLHRRVAEGDLLQCCLCVDADGCHWWEAIRVCNGAEFAAAFLVSPLCPLVESSGLHEGYGVALGTTVEAVDTLVADAQISESELCLLLRAAHCLCTECGTITDDGHRDSASGAVEGAIKNLDGPYRCMDCWNQSRGLGDCRGCGATLVIGHHESNEAGARYFCDECWMHFDKLRRVRGDTTVPSDASAAPSARDWSWLSRTAKDAAHYSTVAQVAASAALTQSVGTVSVAPGDNKSPVDWSANLNPSSVGDVSLTLQLPPTFSATLLVTRRYITEECARLFSPVTVLDLCCGHDAPIAFWAKNPKCHGYLGVDISATAVRSAESFAARALAPAQGGYLSSRLAAALRTTYTVICGDCMLPGFWEQHLPKCLPKPCDAPNLVSSLITCFRPLPLLRLFAGGAADQTRFFEHLADVAAPGAVVVLALLDPLDLRDRSPQSEVSCSATRREGYVRVTFRASANAAASAAGSQREVDLPVVNAAQVIASASSCGFDADSSLLPADALSALQRATRNCSPITTLTTSGSAIGPAVARVEKYWTSSAAATAPIIITDGCEAFLRATRFMVLRRR